MAAPRPVLPRARGSRLPSAIAAVAGTRFGLADGAGPFFRRWPPLRNGSHFHLRTTWLDDGQHVLGRTMGVAHWVALRSRGGHGGPSYRFCLPPAASPPPA